MRALASVLATLVVATASTAAADHDHKKKKQKRVEVSGFLSMIYKFRVEQNGDGVHDPDVFRLGKAVVRVAGRIRRQVGYTVEIDPRSPTIEGVLRDGYISLHVVPGHEVRLGQQKTPFGYESWQSSTSLYTITRSELSEGIGRGVTHRDLGVGLVGAIKLSDDLRIEDAIAVVNGAGFGRQADDTQMKNVWARVGVRWRPAGLVIHAGLSGALGDQMSEPDPGPPPEPAVRFAFRRAGADLEVDHRYFHVGVEGAIGFTRLPADGGETESDLAYFVLVAGKLPHHTGPVVRYDAADAEGFERVTAGVYWGEPRSRFRVLADYEWFTDDAGDHDGRVSVEAIARF